MLLFEVLWPETAGRVMEEVWPDQELRSKFTISPQKIGEKIHTQWQALHPTPRFTSIHSIRILTAYDTTSV